MSEVEVEACLGRIHVGEERLELVEASHPIREVYGLRDGPGEIESPRHHCQSSIMDVPIGVSL